MGLLYNHGMTSFFYNLIRLHLKGGLLFISLMQVLTLYSISCFHFLKFGSSTSLGNNFPRSS